MGTGAQAEKKAGTSVQGPSAPPGFQALQEGSIQILLRGNDVFYNKAQIVNRDLSIAVLRAFAAVREEEAAAAALEKGSRGRKAGTTAGPTRQQEAAPASTGGAALEDVGTGVVGRQTGAEQSAEATDTASGGRREGPSPAGSTAKPMRILEALAASGLRAMRYACEVEGVGEVVALDKDPVAVEACERNRQHNLRRRRRLEKDAAAGCGPMPPEPTGCSEEPTGSGAQDEATVGGAGTGAGTATAEAQAPAPAPPQQGKGQGGEEGDALGRLQAVRAEQGDARLYMLQHEKLFDAVDLDPYGTPSPFLDSAVQAVADGGLLLCTATDMAVLCGNNAEVCHSKYGGYPHRAKYCHEMALRILLACIESHANRYKRHIVPVLSVSVDFYIRVFVRVFTSAQAVKGSPSKVAWVYQCCGCDSFHLQRVGRIVPARARRGKGRGSQAQQGEHDHAGNGRGEEEHGDGDGGGGASGQHAGEGRDEPISAPTAGNGEGSGARGDSLTPAAAAALVAAGGQVRYLPGLGPTVGRHCDDCGKQYAVGGPMWAEPLHDMAWVRQRILPEVERNRAQYPGYAKIHGLLTTVSEELEGVPLFWDLHSMSAVLKCTPPSAVIFRSAILNAGFRVSSTHANPLGLKTDAPCTLLWDIMRHWVKKHPVKSHDPGSPAHSILAKEPQAEASFAKAKGSQSKAQLQKVPRFLPNPEGFWGPKPRARRGCVGGVGALEHGEGQEAMGGSEESAQEDGAVQKVDSKTDEGGLAEPPNKKARVDDEEA